MYEPSDDERTQLAQIIELPGWAVYEKVVVDALAEFRDVVFKLNPLDRDYPQKVVESARRADCAATIWEGIARRIELQMAVMNQPKPKGMRPTPTEAVPDMVEEMNL